MSKLWQCDSEHSLREVGVMSAGGSSPTGDSGVGTASSDSLTRGAGAGGGGRGYGAVRDSSADSAPGVGWGNDGAPRPPAPAPGVSPSSSRFGWGTDSRLGDAICIVGSAIFMLAMVAAAVVMVMEVVKPEGARGARDTPRFRVHVFDGRL